MQTIVEVDGKMQCSGTNQACGTLLILEHKITRMGSLQVRGTPPALGLADEGCVAAAKEEDSSGRCASAGLITGDEIDVTPEKLI